MSLCRLLPSLLLAVSFLAAADPLPLPKSTPWDVQELSKAPEFTWIEKEAPVKSLTYRGLPYRGKPTSVFAYYASPATLSDQPRNGARTTDGRFPAIVLVHGGGGTAFPQWARLWAERGYAAIAMDLAGNVSGAALRWRWRVPTRDR